MRSYDPWRDLASREHIIFTRHPIADRGGGAIYIEGTDGTSLIALSPDLLRAGRRAALTHELAHEERGILAPHASAATMSLEETIVRRVTHERLVPYSELERFIDETLACGDTVTATDVAEEFDVPATIAQEALRALARRHLE